MTKLDTGYDVVIERGHADANDRIFDYLKDRLTKYLKPGDKWLDIGCNTGQLLSEVPNGTGVEASKQMYKLCKEAGHHVYYRSACDLRGLICEYRCVVLSCVLEQLLAPNQAIVEALRVAQPGGIVLGVNPIPGSLHGRVGGTRWVKSVIPPEEMVGKWGGVCVSIDPDRYYFEIVKR